MRKGTDTLDYACNVYVMVYSKNVNNTIHRVRNVLVHHVGRKSRRGTLLLLKSTGHIMNVRRFPLALICDACASAVTMEHMLVGKPGFQILHCSGLFHTTRRSSSCCV